MNRRGWVLLLMVPLALAGCGDRQGDLSELSAGAREALQATNPDMQDRFLAARRQQQEALSSTGAVREDPEKASMEDLEFALNTLNRALLRGQSEVRRLRSSEIQGRQDLIQEIQHANREIFEAYQDLVVHHPDPTPEMLKSGDESDPENAPPS